MGTPTYTPLAEITLGSSAASVTFSSIVGTYRDLVLVYNGTLSAAQSFNIKYNGDSGSNYNVVNAIGDGSSTISYAFSNNTSLLVSIGMGEYTSATTMTHSILDYSATDKHKSSLSRVNVINGGTMMVAGRWASTSAITTILITASSTTFTAGSTFSLYGIEA